ncbi:MAG TPA: twin-arginine translocase subunit TatC [Limnochordia bacterium]
MELAAILAKLAEARRALIVAAICLCCASAVGYVLGPRMLERMTAGFGSGLQLVYLSPAEAFVARLKLAVAFGFLVTLPVLLWQVWRLVGPLLGPAAGRMGLWLIPLATLLFVAGGAFGYFVAVPLALRFLLGFASAGLEPLISISSFVSFLIGVVLPLGAIFEMPVVALCLARVGLLDPKVMARNRRYALLVIAVLAAIFSAPDVFSQAAMALPMLILYEASYWVARCAWRGREAGYWGVTDEAG